MSRFAANEARWTALGTSVHVIVANDRAIQKAIGAVRRVLEDVDATFSRFRDDSELTSLNRSPGRAVRLSPLLSMAIATALRAARISNGAVDPTIGHVLRLLGYDRDFARLLPDGPAPAIESVPGWQVIELDAERRTARLPRGVELDLGSTGKALAADLAAAAAYDAAGCGLLVNLGGDIATAGQLHPAAGGSAADSSDPAAGESEQDEVIAIQGDAIATSSTTVRRWTAGGIVRHHIVDPATGLPAEGPWRTATVVAGSCVDANVAATAAIVLGADAVSWLEATGLPARLIARDGEVRRIGAWPPPLTRAA